MLAHAFRLLVLFASLLVVNPAAAQSFRSYLSSASGNDANPCTLQQPCRLLPRALATVANGGEIWMLDSANFNTGPVTISKSVTILAVPGALGSVVGASGDAISITAAVDVTLRNVNILLFSGTGDGVSVTGSGARVTLDKCEVYGFDASNANGIVVDAPATLTVVDTTVRNNFNGIFLNNGAVATISRSHVVNNVNAGIAAAPSASTATAFVTDTVSSGNTSGFIAGAQGRIIANRTVAAANVGAGYHTLAGGAISVGESMASGNASGFFVGGTISTTGTSLVNGNTTNVSGSTTALPLR